MADELVTRLADPDIPVYTRDRLDLVALATKDLIWDWDLLGHRVTWAGNTQPFFGCDPHEIVAGQGDDHRTWASLVHPDDLNPAEAAAALALNGGADTWERGYRFRRADGSWANVLERAIIVRDGKGSAYRVVGSLRDVTKEIESDEAKTRLAAIVTSSADAIVGKTLEGIVTNWNAAAEKLFGYTAEEMIGQPIFRLIPEELHESERDLLARLRRGERVEVSETERIRKDGARIYISLSVSPIRDASGRLVGASSIKRDVTAEKQSREELRRRDARYRALMTATSSLVWETDPAGRFLAPQAAWEDYTGQSWEEQKALGWLHAFHPDDRGAVQDAWTLACASHGAFEAHGQIWNAGRQAYRHFQARAIPILDDDGAVREWVGMLTDIEDRWVTEERLRQAERMEMVGRLAGGIAHEVNNQMTIVLGAAGFLLQQVQHASAREDVEYIRHAAQRTATITRQLLAYSRRQILQPEVVDLNMVIASLRPILQRALGEMATLMLSLDPGVRSVKADPGQLEQVLLNLVLNARDAMTTGGTVRIETSTALVDAASIRAKPLDDVEPGPYAMLTVSDTGVGMSPETLRHIFEPFFTTKGIGEGSGLGLSTVYGIVKQSGGFVSVSSQLGRGTSFQVFLPLADAPTPASAVVETGEVKGGTETILVVEDDDNVRAFLSRSLLELGYTVLEARDGLEGVDQVERRGGRVDLIVSDVVMPGLGGREFADKVAQSYPGVRVLLISGYPGIDETGNDDDVAKARAFVQKPVAPSDLARTVRALLDAR